MLLWLAIPAVVLSLVGIYLLSMACMTSPLDDDAIIEAIIDGKIWYCGSCESVMPTNYFHRCGESTSVSGPSKEVLNVLETKD